MRKHHHIDAEAAALRETFEIDRRDFLKLAGGGIVLFFTIGELPAIAQQRQARALPTDFNAFLRITENGRIACYVGKIEMGQGIVTSLAQMLADELDTALESIDMVMGDTDLCPWDRGTFGSLSTRSFSPALRAAGAEARLVLLELASEHLSVPAANLAVENGIVFEKDHPQHRVSYGELAHGRSIERHATGKAVVKKFSEFRIMNTSHLRRDGREKVTGKTVYAADMRLPGMLYAKILRPPSHASKLVDVDIAEAKLVKDVVIIHEGTLVAALHRLPDRAEYALSKIKARYETPPAAFDDNTVFDHLLKAAAGGKIVAQQGDINKGKAESAAIVTSTFLDGYKAHAAMEPHAALAVIENGKATVWASTQNPFTCKEEIAHELGFSSENVRVITPYVGGGFGGKTRNLQAAEAARLAQLSGKPVQVAYTRKEEFFFDAFRPAAVVTITSGIDALGKMSAWEYNVYFAGDRGAAHFYTIPNAVTTAFDASVNGAEGPHPFATGAWRAPGNNTNTFARESQIDIMASKAGVDPIEFRLQNMTDKKMRGVLTLAAEKFGWVAAKAPSKRGIGVACGIDAGTPVAAIAEVEVDASTGTVRVKRVVCVQDMGLVVNPEGATIQMEGCITMGLGYALSEHVRFKGGEIMEENFDTYDIPRFSWLPTIETAFVTDNEAPPQGGGEPAIILMGAVIANAVYDAVGARVFQLPITPARVKETLEKNVK
jgi:nicotinate dehydrogenase subunit B